MSKPDGVSSDFPETLDHQAFINQSDETRAHHRDALLVKDYPIVVIKPNSTKNKLIEQEIISKGFLLTDIVSIKITEAQNLLIYFKRSDSYKRFLQLGKFLNGETKEIRKVQEDRTLIIRGANAIDLTDYDDEVKKQGITEYCDLESRKQNVKINMVKAVCESTLTYENLLKNGLKVGVINYRLVKFIRKPNVMICFNCSSPGHIAKFCRNTQKCTRCSSPDHTKNSCPMKDDLNRSNFKCPNCNGQHPATYAGCVKYKETLKKIMERNELNTKDKPKQFTSNPQKNPWNNPVNEQFTQINDKLTVIESNLSTLTNAMNEIQEMKTDVAQFKQNMNNQLTKLEASLKEQENKFVSFSNYIFLTLLSKKKDFDLNEYKSKLINYFNLTLDSNKKLKQHTIPKSNTRIDNNVEMFEDV